MIHQHKKKKLLASSYMPLCRIYHVDTKCNLLLLAFYVMCWIYIYDINVQHNFVYATPFLQFTHLTPYTGIKQNQRYSYALQSCFITKSNPSLYYLKILRGGQIEDESSENDEEDDYDVEEEEEEFDNTLVEQKPSVPEIGGSTSDSLLVALSVRAIKLMHQVAITTIDVSTRVILAAFESDTESDEGTKDASVGQSVYKAICRMWRAAFDSTSGHGSLATNIQNKSKLKAMAEDNGKVKEDSNNDLDSISSSELSNMWPRKQKPLLQNSDIDTFLSKSYNVEATRDNLRKINKNKTIIAPILGGTLTDALRLARSQARLLVVLIPMSKPGKDQTEQDQEAIEGFLSAEVALVAEKSARKASDTRSFLLWCAKAGSAEAASATKRLKAATVNTKGQKRPILLVAYPARPAGSNKVVPRVLAQHHCSPPPSPELMAAWLNALRKRHGQQYAAMQHEVKEGEYFLKRKQGFQSSLQADKEREAREKREEELRLAREKAEAERRQAIEKRREQLRASLPSEPAKNESSMTVALRLADGRNAQRRFSPDTMLTTIFNWVDAEFEMERENITLTTLNGQKSFDWEDSDTTLSKAGFARMTGLRVIKKKTKS